MGTFPCKGGGLNDYVYVFTIRANPEHWRRLLGVIGREDLIGDPRFETPAARAERADEVNDMITDWTRRHTKHEAMEIIGAAGVPAGAVLDTMELTNDPTFEQRGIMQIDRPPASGPFKMVGWPVRFSGSPPPVKPSPLLGQTTTTCWPTGSGLNRTRSAACTATTSSANRSGPIHAARIRGRRINRLTSSRETSNMAELTGSEIIAKCLQEGGHQGSLLHHGRPDAVGRGHLHQGRHPHDRRPPRAGGGLRVPGLQPAEAGAVASAWRRPAPA